MLMASLGGAAASGLSSLLSGGGLFGHRPKTRQMPTVSPEQKQAILGQLQQGMQNASWEPIEARARKQFSEHTIPSIAERFTSMGEGAQGSSAFAGALGSAASDLESQLAALRGEYGMGQLRMGLTPLFENVMEPRQPGAFQSALQGGISAGSSMLPYWGMLRSQQQEQDPLKLLSGKVSGGGYNLQPGQQDVLMKILGLLGQRSL